MAGKEKLVFRPQASLRPWLSLQQITSLQLLELSQDALAQQVRRQVADNPALEWPERWRRFRLGERYSSHAKKQAGPDDWLARQPNPVSLAAHLLAQASLHQDWSAERRHFAEWIVYNLDEKGFHRLDPFVIFPRRHRQVLAQTLWMLQTLDPVGCCCRDVYQSLWVQWRCADSRPPELAALLQQERLKQLATGEWQRLNQETGIPVGRLRSLLAWMRQHLNPNPAAAYSSAPPPALRPELEWVSKQGEEGIVYRGVGVATPEVSDLWQQLPRTHERMREHLQEAKQLCLALSQRKKLLLALAQVIARRQPFFVSQGARGLLELTGQQVADELGIHPSTVSRALAHKYIQTPHGVFSLSFFCACGVPCRGLRFSREAVKVYLLDLLRQSRRRPRDRVMCERLQAMGFQLSRRTVAKYRQELEAEGRYYQSSLAPHP